MSTHRGSNCVCVCCLVDGKKSFTKPWKVADGGMQFLIDPPFSFFPCGFFFSSLGKRKKKFEVLRFAIWLLLQCNNQLLCNYPDIEICWSSSSFFLKTFRLPIMNETARSFFLLFSSGRHKNFYFFYFQKLNSFRRWLTVRPFFSQRELRPFHPLLFATPHRFLCRDSLV